MDRDNTKRLISTWYDFKAKLIFESIAVGLLAGIAVVIYRFTIEFALDFSKSVYAFQHSHYWLIPIWLVLLVLAGLLVGFLVKKEPMIAGSGIPQVKGILLKRLKMNWLRVLLYKFIGGVLCIGAGLSLGREGPSIQLGSSVGQGFSRMLKRAKIEERYLITCGASAGLAAAFNAPLAGVIFSLEELHKNFSPTIMISALVASISADFVSKEFFGLQPVFNFKNIHPIPLNQYFYLIFLGGIIGLMGIVFNKSLVWFQDLYAKQKWLRPEARPVIPFALAGLVGFFLPDVLGGGNGLVNSLIQKDPSILMLFILLAAKFLFTMVSYGSSAPGGIFLPLLVIGAIIGNVFSDAISVFSGFGQMYAANFIILAMAGYFSAVVKAPITGIILITEMTGNFSNLLSVGIVSLVAYIVTEIFQSEPIYDILLDRVLRKGQSPYEPSPDNKSLIEACIHMGSALEGKKVKDVDWPAKCLIVGIKRGEREIIPNGNTVLLAGDYLIVITDEENAADARESLSQAAENVVLNHREIQR